MSEERRDGLLNLVREVSSLKAVVEGTNARLDKINGSIEHINQKCPQYREKVDNLESDIKVIEPKLNKLMLKVYTGVVTLSLISSLIGASIMKWVIN